MTHRPIAIALFVSFASTAAAVEPFDLRPGDEERWYRGNMHTHSLWSDGDDYLESIAKWYREHDYQFLVFTDHNVLANRERWTDVAANKGGMKAYEKLKAAFPDEWVEERTVEGRLQVRLKTFAEIAKRFDEPGRFLLIQGGEITDRFKNRPVHMNATNTPELVPPMHGESVREVMQNNVDRVRAIRERTGQPILIHLNHPNFGYGVTAEDLMVIRGENFFEVYNGHPGVNNSGDAKHIDTEKMWDAINARRATDVRLPTMYGLATDDGHSYHRIPSRASEPGRGWVRVLAKDLSPKSLIEALEAGRFHASSGVALERITVDAKGMEVVVAAEKDVTYTIEFIGTDHDFAKSPTAEDETYPKSIGRVLHSVVETRARYDFTGEELYVRARVTSSRKHPNPSEVDEFERAWTQPVRVRESE